MEIVLEERVLPDLPILGLLAQDDFEAAARRGVLTDMGDEPVDLGLRNRALLHIHHQPAIMLYEADMEPLNVLIPLAADHDPVAVVPGTRVGERRQDRARLKTTQTLEDIAYLLVLILELGPVLDVLILAAAADAKVFAARFDPLGRGLQHLEEPRARILPLELGDLDGDSLPGDHERDENDEVIQAADPLAAKGQIAHLQCQLRPRCQHGRRLGSGFGQRYVGPQGGRCQMFTHGQSKNRHHSSVRASEEGIGR